MYQCYDLDNFKLILKLDADYNACEEQLRLAANENEQLSAALDGLGSAVAAHKDVIEALKTENNRLLSQWEDESRRRLEAENKHQLLKWSGWIAAIVLAASTATLAVTFTYK